MIIPEIARWSQTPVEIHRLAFSHPNVRTRERYLALSKVLDGLAPYRVAEAMKKSETTIYTWLRRYNKLGPKGIEYKHTGGRPPSFPATGG
tara:strand:- start:1216 stop:1488 length:273 start_codon:yes stop_codon:yes gene_type:complete